MNFSAFCITMCIFFLSPFILATEVKVEKVKANKAIIVLPEGSTIQEGKLYQLELENQPKAPMERNRIIGISGTLGQMTTSTSGTKSSATEVSGQINYGWNMKQYEYGPAFEMEYSQSESSSKIGINMGGFYDYNVVPNSAEVLVVPGLTLRALIGVGQSTVSDVKTNKTMTQFGVGIFNKWFTFGPDSCLRGDILYTFGNSTEGDTKTSITSFALVGGFQIYF